MSEEQPVIGSVTWRDLTVEDATSLKDFYAQVAGWAVEEADLGEYRDFVMKSANDEPVAGICHARGSNSGLPPQWLMYITVANIDESIRHCESLGGQVIAPKRDMGGYGTMCVIQDPAGAVAALMQPPG